MATTPIPYAKGSRKPAANPSFRPSGTAGFKRPYDTELYKERNVIERFNKLKQFRRVAPRYDNILANFIGFVKLAAIERLRACRLAIELRFYLPALLILGDVLPRHEVCFGARTSHQARWGEHTHRMGVASLITISLN
jgi:hypothetical protein